MQVRECQRITVAESGRGRRLKIIPVVHLHMK